ncbi:hyaluronate lyase N-terminal domain-containing protein [Vibrio diabolicus]|uniref:hyaluronate lyase N-terminal domain-containing protein n=1 Tax=Vibrio diabolicus TaxID=50719 RepID=UPI00215E5835|nr:hypothetical protein [Vibrio diabolicus]MCS0306340.1 hypothetical protein [Vibrio diabolicus]
MANQIQIRRGPAANRTDVTPANGEPLWITDAKRLYVGDGETPGGIDLFSILGSSIWKDAGTSPGQVLVLGGDGKIPTEALPGLSIGDIFEVSSQSAMLALNAQQGDTAVRSDINKTYVLKAEPANILSNWVWLRTPTDIVLSVNGKVGAVTVTKSDVGLGNVTNESKSTMFSSPAFTGSPTTPTQNITDNSTKIASTEWVRNWVNSLGLAVEGGNIDGGTF